MNATRAAAILRKVLGSASDRLIERDTPAGRAFAAGLAYATASEAERGDIDVTLAGANLLLPVTAVLLEGQALADVGRALGGFKTAQQARAFAIGQITAALHLIAWHRDVLRQERQIAEGERNAHKRKIDGLTVQAKARAAHPAVLRN